MGTFRHSHFTNKCVGTTGSSAYLSTTTKITKQANAAQNMPMTIGESHGAVWPPTLKATMTKDRNATRKIMPKKSIRLRPSDTDLICAEEGGTKRKITIIAVTMD